MRLTKDFVHKYFFKGHERSIKAKKNIIASVFIKSVSIAIGLLLVPITIDYVNPSRYGIWLTLSSIIGWFSFFDIGFGNGLRNRLTEAQAKEDFKLARIYISTTYAILCLIIGAVIMLFLFINPFLNWTRILNTDPSMADELSILAFIVFIFFCIQFILQIINTVLAADQRPAIAGLLTMLSSLVALSVIFILTKITNGSLLYLALTMGMAPVVILAGSSLWLYNSIYKKYRPSPKFVYFRYVRDLMSLGLQFFFIQVSSVIVFMTSNIIISQLFGPTEVTSYNVAFRYFSVNLLGFNIILMPFWSAFTDSYYKNEFQWIMNSVEKLMLLWILFSFVALVMVLFASPIYKLWVGPEIHIPFSLSLLMGLYVCFNNLNSIFVSFINGVGKIRIQLWFSILTALIFIPLTVFLGHWLGVQGVILSSLIITISACLWSPVQYYKLINQTASGLWNK